MAITRVNLCLAPTGRTPGPGWVLPAGWAYATGLSATLPRQVGVAGGAASNVLSAVGPVVPGRTYVGSISIRAIAASTGTVALAWTNAANVVIAVSATTPFTLAANTTGRIASPATVAPPDAAVVQVVVTGLDGSSQLTAAMIEQASVAGVYFDGDTAGARWAGEPGTSLSVIGTSELAATTAYDDSTGRVRVLASGAAPVAGRAQVGRRTTRTTTVVPVRGGSLPLVGGATVGAANDYEFPAGPSLVYRVDAHAGAVPLPVPSPLVGRTPVAPIESLEVFAAAPYARAWLKFPAAPHLNRKVTVTDWTPIERRNRNALYEVKGRPDPVVVTAGHSSRQTTLRLRTFTIDETDALDLSMRQGIPGFLHMPDGGTLPSLYVVFGDYQYARAATRSVGSIFTVPVVEVSAPPASIFARPVTWGDVLAEHPTYQALLDSAPTWQEVTA